MDPFLQLLTSNTLVAAGGWGLLFGWVMWVAHGFTSRGWSTPKQRARSDAREDSIRAEVVKLKDDLLLERKETADRALEAVGTLSETAHAQQATISNMDSLVGKIPVKVIPQTGGKPRTRTRSTVKAEQ